LLRLPGRDERIAALKAELRRANGVAAADARVVVSPYRICPLGAHVDHQLGVVTGMALDQAVLLVFAPAPARAKRRVTIRSMNFPGETVFDLDAIPPQQPEDWGNYVRGAAAALRGRFGGQLRRGMVGIVDGDLPIGGLSSSAAVGVAYLLGLEAVNSLTVSIPDNIQLDRAVENGYIGLHNGILDQSVILASRRDQLITLDCRTEQWRTARGPSRDAHQIMVVHSGVTESLVATGYNQRVAECREAARLLLAAARKPVPNDVVLRQVSEPLFRHHGLTLPMPLRKRAMHFFTEQARVREGAAAWEAGDLGRFGALVTQSGRSSIENYECGCPHLVTIYELLAAAPGVFGARFSGAGFRGSCIALVEPARAPAVAATVAEGYARRHPDEAKQMAIALCQSDDGARLVAG
jgi:galactokinase